MLASFLQLCYMANTTLEDLVLGRQHLRLSKGPWITGSLLSVRGRIF